MSARKEPSIKEMAETMRAISNILVILEPLPVESRASVLAGAASMSGVNDFLVKSNPEIEAKLKEFFEARRARREHG